MRTYHIILCLLMLSSCGEKEETAVPKFEVKPEVPTLILEDHAYFLDSLKPITSYKDSTGIMARELFEVMEFHFREEEDYILPPLGILPLLAMGELPEEREKVIHLSEKFSENREAMLAEHQMIEYFVGQMVAAAKRENHADLSDYESKLKKHAELEEEILFPTVLLIGKYLKLKEE